jgi:transcriptional regulator with XRE-family HTH domain
LTQAQVGDALGISARVIGYYESGDRLPKDAETYLKIADLFRCSLDFLFGRSLVKNCNGEDPDAVKVDKTVLLDVLSHMQRGIDILNEYLPSDRDINPDETKKE